MIYYIFKFHVLFTNVEQMLMPSNFLKSQRSPVVKPHFSHAKNNPEESNLSFAPNRFHQENLWTSSLGSSYPKWKWANFIEKQLPEDILIWRHYFRVNTVHLELHMHLMDSCAVKWENSTSPNCTSTLITTSLGRSPCKNSQEYNSNSKTSHMANIQSLSRLCSHNLEIRQLFNF